ncbi:MAG: hypothetical protein KDC13_06280, partial [Bacteroidetes bacterium]|nr:hypothetical protein [Bacteroidota bacterium]
QQFPVVPCKDVNGKTKELNLSASAKPSVVFVQKKAKSGEMAESWIDPLVQKFIRKSGMLDAMFDADLVFLAYLNQIEAGMVEKSTKKVKEEIPAELHSGSYFSTESPDAVESIVLSGADSFIVVVSAEGRILGSVQGKYTEEKMEMIEDWLNSN